MAPKSVLPMLQKMRLSFESTGRMEWETGEGAVLVLNSPKERPDVGELVLTAEPEARDGQDDELDVRVLTPKYSSADRRFRK